MDEDLYIRASLEIDEERESKSLWVKAMTICDGDSGRARYEYIRLRVEQLRLASSSDKDSDNPQNSVGTIADPSGIERQHTAFSDKILTAIAPSNSPHPRSDWPAYIPLLIFVATFIGIVITKGVPIGSIEGRALWYVDYVGTALTPPLIASLVVLVLWGVHRKRGYGSIVRDFSLAMVFFLVLMIIGASTQSEIAESPSQDDASQLSEESSAKFYDELSQLYPAWKRLRHSHRFNAWLDDFDLGIGVQRRSLLDDAHNRLDASSAASIYIEYEDFPELPTRPHTWEEVAQNSDFHLLPLDRRDAARSAFYYLYVAHEFAEDERESALQRWLELTDPIGQ